MKDKCIILGCGPSLTEISPKKLTELSSTHLIFAIKQAYNYSPVVDYHFINDNNYSQYEYGNGNTKVIVEFPSNHFVHTIAATAHEVFKVEQNFDYDKSLSKLLNFDDWSFENSRYVRPWGPGIMYELVLFYAHFLKVKEIITFGWDLGPPSSTTRDHFYQHEVMNKAHNMNSFEADNEINLTREFYYWLKKEGIDLSIGSSNSYAHKDIPRIKV